MEKPECTKWTGRKFIFIALHHNTAGDPPKEVARVRIEGTVTGVVVDEKSGTSFIEISTRNVYLYDRVFAIVNKVITLEKGKKPFLFFDAKRRNGYDCFTGEFMLIE